MRIVEHLRRQGHQALVVAPDEGPDEHDGVRVVRVPAVSIPGATVPPVGLPTWRLQTPVVTGSVEVTGGVDTHKDTHTAAVVDAHGRVLGHREFPTSTAGYRALLGWLRSHGELVKVGIEGTGAYGAGLARYLQAAGVALVEVDRPDRTARRHHGKSDPVDAQAAARAAQAGRATGVPKDRAGGVEALRALRVARRGAVAARARAQTQMTSLIVTAPDPLRAQLRGLSQRQLVARRAARRPDRAAAADPGTATVLALRALARRQGTDGPATSSHPGSRTRCVRPSSPCETTRCYRMLATFPSRDSERRQLAASCSSSGVIWPKRSPGA